MISQAVELYVAIIQEAIPYALVFGLSNLIVNTFLSAAFSGKLKIGG